ncbi:MAG: hypothetical protein ACK4RW_09760 [Rehaibacterium terrae]|uniref:hypothetical protein n=1 Tax=Rehaibacterium terrae TaxID=1341696 RepID=UPI0039192509
MIRLRPREAYLRRRWRRGLLTLVLLAIAAGYALLAVPPEAPAAVAIDRAFAGMGLVAAGAIVALASRLYR